MSHHSKRRALKRRKARMKKKALVIPCQQCGATPDTTPAVLLQSIADSLNAYKDACGEYPKLRHGIVMTYDGYVIPRKGGRWGAAVLQKSEMSPPRSVIARDEDYEDD